MPDQDDKSDGVWPTYLVSFPSLAFDEPAYREHHQHRHASRRWARLDAARVSPRRQRGVGGWGWTGSGHYSKRSPLTALFLTIAVGYLVGEVNLKGFALGSGAVLFVGLACGAFAPKSAPPGMLGTLGLLLFLYCVGIQYGERMVPRSHQPRGPEGQLRRAVRLDRGGRGLADDLRDRRRRTCLRRSGCSPAPARAPRRCRRFSTRSGTRTRRSATA